MAGMIFETRSSAEERLSIKRTISLGRHAQVSKHCIPLPPQHAATFQNRLHTEPGT